jgi:phospholipid transport system substrate-binding protein
MRPVRIFVLGVFAALVLMSSNAHAVTAVGVIEKFHAALLDVMRSADKLEYAGRYRALAPRVAESFDLKFMAQVSSGRYWKAFDAAQRDHMVNAFRRFTVASYASRFKSYAGQKFETLGEEKRPRGTTIVRTVLVKKDGETVSLEYLLRPVGESWRIVDIYLKGRYSELATRRSEYTSVLRRNGLDSLLAIVDKKIANLEK